MASGTALNRSRVQRVVFVLSLGGARNGNVPNHGTERGAHHLGRATSEALAGMGVWAGGSRQWWRSVPAVRRGAVCVVGVLQGMVACIMVRRRYGNNNPLRCPHQWFSRIQEPESETEPRPSTRIRIHVGGRHRTRICMGNAQEMHMWEAALIQRHKKCGYGTARR